MGRFLYLCSKMMHNMKEPEVRKADVSTELELPLSPARLRISPTSPLIGAMPQPRSYPPAIL